jgi:hypothetical protein
MMRALELLRPHPHRGDVIAAGAVPLALAAVVIELRMRQWTLGPRFAVVALIAALILTMAWLAPLEGDAPRAYHSILLVSGLLVLAVALQLLAEILGAHRPPGAGADFWTFGTVAAASVVAARRFNSAVCTLIAALAGIVSIESVVSALFHPSGLDTFRWVLLVLSLAFVGGALGLRERRRRHSVQLVNAAGVAALILALTFLVTTLVAQSVSTLGARTPLFVGTGASSLWKLYVLAAGLGLVAYSGVDREPGPGYLGAVVLGSFVLLVGVTFGAAGSLVFWPLFLLVAGGALLAVGLRPRRPLPPPPGSGTAETVPFHPGSGAGA